MPDDAVVYSKISEIESTILGRTIAIVWYQTRVKNCIFTVSELGALLQSTGLSVSPNLARIKEDLRKSKCVVVGKANELSIAVAKVGELNRRYREISVITPEISDLVIDKSVYHGTRKYIEQIGDEINATYQYSMYNSTAVMMRRIMESLIIEVYISKGQDKVIRGADGEFLMLSNLLATVKSGVPVKFSRNFGKMCDEIKNIGDKGAHSRTYIVSRQDIDGIVSNFRSVLSELLHESGIVK